MSSDFTDLLLHELSLQEAPLQNMWLGAGFLFFVLWKELEEVKGKQISILYKNFLVSIC